MPRGGLVEGGEGGEEEGGLEEEMGEAEEEEAKDEEVGEEGRMRKPRTRTGWVPCSNEVTRTERCEEKVRRSQSLKSCNSWHDHVGSERRRIVDSEHKRRLTTTGGVKAFIASSIKSMPATNNPRSTIGQSLSNTALIHSADSYSFLLAAEEASAGWAKREEEREERCEG